jgi:uncharacterized protein YdbL (DUF1318 family)
MKRASLCVAASVAILAGCVVIPKTFDANINVTIRQIQQQADQILDAIGAPPPAASAPKKTSLLRSTIDLFDPMPVAYAADVKEDSPRIKQLVGSMKARYPEVDAATKTGAAGENNRGLLELVKPEKISDAEKKNAVQRTIAAENDDRKALYQEIARLNSDQNLTVSAVERVYAQKRLERAQPGELFQLPPAGQDFTAFANSPVGKKLGGSATAGAWVTIP